MAATIIDVFFMFLIKHSSANEKGSDPVSFAGEVRGIVKAARSCVGCYLWMRTQRSSAIDNAIGRMLGDDRLRRFSFFDPSLDHAHLVEVVGTGTAATMRHPRHHEQPNRVRRVLRGADHGLVVIDAV